MLPTVVVVDDHEVVRQGLRRALEGAPGIGEVVGEAGTVAAARALIDRTTPDVVVIDIVLPDGDGLQLCREVVSDHPGIGCILLTSFPEARGMLSAAVAGAKAYLPKDASAAEVVDAVAAVARGEQLLDHAEVVSLLQQLVDRSGEDPRMERLTPQERRVFELVGQGLSNRQIAEELSLAERTVKNYVSRMLTKLDMDRRTEAAVLSARLSERRGQQTGRRAG